MDASDYGLDSILIQENRIVSVFSKRFNSAQMNYTVTEKEALAIIESLKHFRTIILNTDLTIHTDHSNFKFLGSSKIQRIQRWALIIEEFSPKILYIKGQDNSGADFLSRCLIISQFSEKKDLIDYYHNELIHPGSKRLFNTIKDLGHGITRKDIEEFTSKCEVCQKIKPTNPKLGILSGTISIDLPWKTVALDIIGPLREGEEYQKTYLLNIMDHGSRLSKIEILKSCTEKEVMKKFKPTWLNVFTLPQKVVTNSGKQFIGRKFEQLLKEFNITHQKVLPYNPQGNSVIERSHATLTASLRALHNMNLKDEVKRLCLTYHSTHPT